MADLLERLQAEVLDPLEVTTVVGHEHQVMLKCGRADQEIEVTDDIPFSAESSAGQPEQFAGIKVNADERDAVEEVRKIRSFPSGSVE